MSECWKPIPGYPTYEASDAGRIRTRDEVSGITHVLSQHISKVSKTCRYLTVSITDAEGRLSRQNVHKLVALAFFGPRPDGYDTRHLNGDSFDNCLDNLKYGTRAENEADKYRMGRGNNGERHGKCKLTDADVAAIRQSTARGVDLCRLYGVSPATISAIRAGKTRNKVYAFGDL